ncbi:50S ribosomal protein L6 [bacterium BMS3Bbin03]|nr:50S ribosomal protein L6 [bacterium BMS3Bbin03]HDL78984.1 50S ribosomal protein L6 [Bacteroidota bacterium]
MSRIGRAPIPIPEGVTVDVHKNTVQVKGPKGELKQRVNPDIRVELQENEILVKRPTDNRLHRSLHGLYRSLLNNMVLGVSQGFEKRLEIIGVGYRVEKKGKSVTFLLGYSHPIVFIPPEGIEVNVESNTQLVVRGISKELVGLVAAKIRSFRPPEPYKGKGIRYAGEQVRRKTGKSGAK